MYKLNIPTDIEKIIIEKLKKSRIAKNGKALKLEAQNAKPNISAKNYPFGSAVNLPRRNLTLSMTHQEISELGRLIPESYKESAAEDFKLDPKAGRVDPNAMEVWLNETLAEAAILVQAGSGSGDFPNMVDRGGASAKYGVDRLTLLNSGLSQTAIE